MIQRRTFVSRSHPITQVFVFVLLGIFAVMSTLMVLLSAQLYRDVVGKTEQNSTYRILTSYVANAVRSGDGNGGISTDCRNGVDMLVLTTEEEGWTFETLIYCHDGALRELFTDAGQEFDPEYGEIICSAQSFTARTGSGLLTIDMTDAEGDSVSLEIALRSSQEAGR